MKDRKRILINYRMEQAEQAIKDTEILLNEGGSSGATRFGEPLMEWGTE